MKAIDRIYPHLTPNASAALVWGLMCDSNHSEAEKVAATVVHEMRLAPVQEFGVTIFGCKPSPNRGLLFTGN